MWTWYFSTEEDIYAEFDYDASAPLNSSDYLSATRIRTDLCAVYRSRNRVSEISKFHCPQIDTSPIIDDVWRRIILKFVPPDKVQFLSVKIYAKDGMIDKYMWVVPFARVSCLDLKKSKIGSLVKGTNGESIAFRVKRFIAKDNCLSDNHLARDLHDHSFILVSNELRDALADTGEESMFYSEQGINERLENSILGS
jgi:hypothetical protein